MLHSNGKRQYSLQLAKKIIENKIVKDDMSEFTTKLNNNLDIDRLSKISINLKKLLKLID